MEFLSIWLGRLESFVQWDVLVFFLKLIILELIPYPHLDEKIRTQQGEVIFFFFLSQKVNLWAE